MNRRIECTLREFAGDTYLSGVVAMSKGEDALQKDKIKQAHVHLKMLSKAKCKVLRLGQGRAQLRDEAIAGHGA